MWLGCDLTGAFLVHILDGLTWLSSHPRTHQLPVVVASVGDFLVHPMLVINQVFANVSFEVVRFCRAPRACVRGGFYNWKGAAAGHRDGTGRDVPPT